MAELQSILTKMDI